PVTTLGNPFAAPATKSACSASAVLGAPVAAVASAGVCASAAWPSSAARRVASEARWSSIAALAPAAWSQDQRRVKPRRNLRRPDRTFPFDRAGPAATVRGRTGGTALTVLREPVHGDIELSAEETRLIDTPESQRLRGVKQLGFAYLVFPGAMHTRFEHSIGTLHMCEQMVQAANRNAARDPAACMQVGEEARRILRISALLHDVTHIPFGHNIEDQTGLLPRHDRPERFHSVLGDTALGRALDALGLRDTVLSVLGDGGAQVPPFWRQMISDTIDADLLDYLRRDAWYTGLELRYDRRVIDYFRVDRKTQRLYVDCDKNGILREDIVSEFLPLLHARYH